MPGSASVLSFPLSTAQSSMWLAQQFDPRDPSLCVAHYLDITGPLDPGALRTAAEQAIDGVEALRAHVDGGPDGAAPRWVVEPAVGWDLPVLDLSAETRPLDAARAVMAADLAGPLDPGRAPLFRTALFRLAAGHHLWYQRCHHVALDGFGAALFARHLADRYSQLTGHPTQPHPTGPFEPLATLTALEQDYRASAAHAADREYWLHRRTGLPEATTLLPGTAARARRPRLPARASASLPPEVARAARDLARQVRVPWPVVLTAVVAAYLHRLSDRDDVVVGFAVTGRPGATAQRTPGSQSDVLPLHVRLDPGRGLGDLAVHVAGEVRDLLRHQRYRSEYLAEDAGPAGAWDRPGIEVNAMPFDRGLRLGECTATIENLANGPVQELAVGLRGTTRGEHLTIDLDAPGELFPDGLLAEHAARLARYTAAVLEDPARPLGRVATLSDPERHRVMREAAGPAGPVPTRGLLAPLAHRARTAPDTLAVRDDTVTLTYRQLTGRAARLAWTLRTAGAGRGAVVGLLAERGADLVTAVVGVLAAGAAFVPLDPAAPERAARVLTDCDAAWVLTDARHADAAAALAVSAPRPPRVLSLTPADDTPADDETLTDTLAEDRAAPDDLAYVMFTSGSTGRPKGAMVTRHGMLNHLLAKVEDLRLGEGDVVVQNAPLTFDVSVWQMLAALVAGGAVRVCDDVAAADPDPLFRRVADDGVTVLEVVPSLLRASLDAWDAGVPAPPLPRLRTLVVTGETLPPRLCRRWLRRYPAVPVVNAYGPAECSDDVTHAVVTDPRQLDDATHVPIGTPLRNTRLHVLDRRLDPLPPGVAGDLYVSGDGVGRGYLGAPGLTATAFVADPFSSRPGGRMYRTGDRVVRRADGALVFLGRRDDQVKVNGQRIELGEVETALRALPGVAAAAVTAVPAPGGRTVLVGHVVPSADAPAPAPAEDAAADGAAAEDAAADGAAAVAGIRAALAARLPRAMVPSLVVPCAALPLTANGKVDRAALAASVADRLTAPPPTRPPASPAERALAVVFSDVLGTGPVGSDDSFFALGGDSIAAIQVASRARAAGLALTARQVLEHDTVASLALAAGSVAPAATEPPGAGTGTVPLTPLMHDLREAGGPVDGYHQAVLVDVPARTSRPTLVAAVRAVLDRHDMLRARLHTDGGWRLDVPPPGPLPADDLVTVRPLPAGPGAGHETGHETDRAVADARRAATARLSPVAGRMIDLTLLTPDAGERALLLVVVHHLAVDALSWHPLLTDLALAWQAADRGRPDEDRAGPVPASFRGWARRLEREAADPSRRHELTWWRHVLSEGGRLVTARPRDPRLDPAGEVRTRSLTLDAALTRALTTDLPRLYHADAEDVLLTALACALTTGGGLTLDRTDAGVLVDVEGHGRDAVPGGPDVSGTVGWFGTRYPVRLDPGPGTTPGIDAAGGQLKRVKEQRRAVPGHADGQGRGLGYGLLRHLAADTRETLAALPPPEIGWNYVGRTATTGRLAATGWRLAGTGELVEGLDPKSPVGHALDINAATRQTPDGPCLTATWSWAPGLLDADDVAASLAAWQRELERLAAHARSPRAGGRTPSDLTLAAVTQDEIDEFEADLAADLDLDAGRGSGTGRDRGGRA